MSTKGKFVRVYRRYSEDFKREIVRLYDSGKNSATQLSILYELNCKVIYDWVYRYSSFNKKSVQIVEMKDSHTNKMKALEQKVRDLERLVGQKQIKIDFLETMIEVAKEELHIDIKKKSSTPPSTESKNKK
jgi:transposase-like protein